MATTVNILNMFFISAILYSYRFYNGFCCGLFQAAFHFQSIGKHMDVVHLDGLEDGLHLLDGVEVEDQLPIGAFFNQPFRDLVLQQAEYCVERRVGAKTGIQPDEQVAARHLKDGDVGGEVFLDEAQIEGVSHLYGLVVDEGK